MHILLVEDHADTRRALSTLLVRSGHDVATANNFHDAVELLSNLRFDALVSDIGLPDRTGLDLVREARKRQPLQKAVAVTAYATPHDEQRGRLAGFDHYLTKPLDFDRLRSVLASTS